MIHLNSPDYAPGWTDALPHLPDGATILAVDNVQAIPDLAGLFTTEKATGRPMMAPAVFNSETVQRAQAALRHRQLEELAAAKELSGGRLRGALRHWYDPAQVFGGSYTDNVTRARQFWASFIDETFRQYAAKVDYVLEWNEYLANSQNEAELQARISWVAACLAVWNGEYRSQSDYAHIRPIICNAAVGNDIDRRFAALAQQYGAIVGYHNYSHYQNGQRDPGDRQFHSGRIWIMYDDWKSYGITVPVALTEGGPYEGPITGWQASACLGANVEAMLAANATVIREARSTRAWADGKVEFMVYFCTGGRGAWETFNLIGSPLVEAAKMYAREWTGQPIPPPADTLKKRLWAASVQAQINHGIMLNPAAGLQQTIFQAGLVPVHNEAAAEGYTIQAGESLDGSRPRRVYVWQAGKPIWYFTDPT